LNRTAGATLRAANEALPAIAKAGKRRFFTCSDFPLTSARLFMGLELSNATAVAFKENSKKKAEINKAADAMDDAELFAKFIKKSEEVAQAAV
jgi:hypothetical protein